jgi:hypothetical protein
MKSLERFTCTYTPHLSPSGFHHSILSRFIIQGNESVDMAEVQRKSEYKLLLLPYKDPTKPPSFHSPFRLHNISISLLSMSLYPLSSFFFNFHSLPSLPTTFRYCQFLRIHLLEYLTLPNYNVGGIFCEHK